MFSYFIGTSGWNYSHWKRRFYPENLKKKNWFQYYSKRFNTVEVNASFYRWPSKKNMKEWKKQAPKGFKYTIKSPRTITHIKRLKEPERYVKDFYELTSLLGDKKGAHLFQLPPSFKKDERNLKRLKKFLEVLDARKDNVIEFRDKSWWKKEVYDLLRKHKVGFVIVCGLGMPKDIVESKIAYFRFHRNNYKGKYSKKEIKKYAKVMKSLIKKNKKVYAYFNNDEKAYAVENAKELREELNENGKNK